MRSKVGRYLMNYIGIDIFYQDLRVKIPHTFKTKEMTVTLNSTFVVEIDTNDLTGLLVHGKEVKANIQKNKETETCYLSMVTYHSVYENGIHVFKARVRMNGAEEVLGLFTLEPNGTSYSGYVDLPEQKFIYVHTISYGK